MHICLYSLPWDCKYERYFVFPEYPQSESGTSGSAPGCSTLLLFAVPPIQTTKLPEKLPNHGTSQQPTTSHRRDHNLSRRPQSSLLPTSKSSTEVHLPCRCPPPHSSRILSFAWPSFSPQLTNSKRTNNCKPSCSYFHSFDLSKAVIPTQIYKTNIRPINTLQIINLYSLVALLYISDHHNLQKYIFSWKKKKPTKLQGITQPQTTRCSAMNTEDLEAGEQHVLLIPTDAQSTRLPVTPHKGSYLSGLRTHAVLCKLPNK